MLNMGQESEINKRDVEFLYEVGCLRFIPRMWRQFNPHFANLAEHMLRVIWIGIIIAKYEKADTGKVVKMALVHDLGESRTGDAHFLAKLYTTRDEDKAVNDILEDTALKGEFLELWREYEKRDSIESKIVKDADNLDVDFELQEQAIKGVGLRDHWRKDREQGVYPNLYTDTAKKMWEMIYASGPNDWLIT